MREFKSAQIVSHGIAGSVLLGLRRERGAILPLVAVTMIGLLGVLVLALDAGNLQRQKRLTQTAADAGAQAGALEIFRNQPVDSVHATVRVETARNGYTDGTGGVVVIDSIPVVGGNFTGSKYVKVIVKRPVPTIFAGIYGRTSVTVRAEAIAGVVGGSPSCLVTLDSIGIKSFDMNSGSHITASNCDVTVDSNNSMALNLANSATLAASNIYVVGGYSAPGGSASFPPPTNGPIPGSPAATDPLASLTVPPEASAACNAPYGLTKYTANTTISPGVYCGGIKVIAGVTVTMSPGIYVIKGGGMDVAGTLNGPGGVSIINMNPNPADAGPDKFSVINIQSQAMTLTAPTSGSMAGILFYSPPLQGVASKRPYNNLIHSDALVTNLTGSMYFPDQRVDVKSGADMTIVGGVVSFSFLIGGGNINMNTGLGGSSGVKRPTIVQ